MGRGGPTKMGKNVLGQKSEIAHTWYVGGGQKGATMIGA